MVLLTTTPQILTAIASLPSNTNEELSPLPTSTAIPIEHQTLIHLSQSTKTPLNTLLRGTRPYFPPPPPKPSPSPEYLALKARLLAEQEEREYAAFMHRQHQSADEEADTKTSDEINPSLVLNILLSIVLCGFAVFHVTRHWHNDGLRVLVALGAGIVVGVAEVGVFAAYLKKKADAKDRERRKKEKKVVIAKEIVKAEDKMKKDFGSMEKPVERKEEIWGRGVNGGMRRRVREKWERERETQIDSK